MQGKTGWIRRIQLLPLQYPLMVGSLYDSNSCPSIVGGYNKSAICCILMLSKGHQAPARALDAAAWTPLWVEIWDWVHLSCVDEVHASP